MKFVALVSSGIDSPVAAYLFSKKAEQIILVHADNRPFTDSSEIDHFMLLAKYLKQHLSCPIKAYVVPHGIALAAYKEHAEHHFTCVFCKRMMVRYAEAIAKKENACAIIMGDSLGQVASQTLQNIRVVDQATTIPILRPLIGFDKEDITRIAKEIGTYDLSILPSGGCLAVPDKPSTRAKLEQIFAEEKKIDVSKLIESVVKEAVPVEL
jgi:tRNA uracil 4-sulfurtransferase